MLSALAPANYTEDDPFDVDGTKQMVDDLHTEWWLEPPNVQNQAIANAFRATMVSPRQNLKWNSIVYQDISHIPPDVSDPDAFEDAIRESKLKWDKFNQMTLDAVSEKHPDNEELINYARNNEKYQPGIWGNVRKVAAIGPYIDQIREAALTDIAQGGDGRIFRQIVLNMKISGVGPKVASFAWLVLAPRTSELGTIDVHMLRHLHADDPDNAPESPKDMKQYLDYEQQLQDQKNNLGYNDVPLGAYQWAVWDKTRTPGYHQDHTALRPLNPTDWRDVDWAPQPTKSRKAPSVPDNQIQMPLSNWKPAKWIRAF